MSKMMNYARVSMTAKSEGPTGKTVLNGSQDNNSVINRERVYGVDTVRAYYSKISAIFPQSTVTFDEFAGFLAESGITVRDEVN